MTVNKNYKNGNRCPQGEFWVQPPGKKGFCRAIGKRKGGQSVGSSLKTGLKYATGQNKIAPSNRKSLIKGTAAGLAVAAGLTGLVAVHKVNERSQGQKKMLGQAVRDLSAPRVAGLTQQ